MEVTTEKELAQALKIMKIQLLLRAA